MNYNSEKFRALMLYISQQLENDEAFGATVLNKVLFFSDFLAFRELGDSITGAVYQKLDHGPAPRTLLAEQHTLVERHHAVVREGKRGPYPKRQLVALVEADLSLFSGQEIALVDKVISLLRGHGATEVSEVSHQAVGWLAAELGADIPYATIFILPPREATLTQLTRALEIESELIEKSA